MELLQFLELFTAAEVLGDFDLQVVPMRSLQRAIFLLRL